MLLQEVSGSRNLKGNQASGDEVFRWVRRQCTQLVAQILTKDSCEGNNFHISGQPFRFQTCWSHYLEYFAVLNLCPNGSARWSHNVLWQSSAKMSIAWTLSDLLQTKLVYNGKKGPVLYEVIFSCFYFYCKALEPKYHIFKLVYWRSEGKNHNNWKNNAEHQPR